jgi:hypothetical protein
VRTGHVAGVFVQIPWDLAGDRVGAATRLELADVAIQFAGAIESCALGRDAASGNGVCASELDVGHQTSFHPCPAKTTQPRDARAAPGSSCRRQAARRARRSNARRAQSAAPAARRRSAEALAGSPFAALLGKPRRAAQQGPMKFRIELAPEHPRQSRSPVCGLTHATLRDRPCQ